MNKIDFMNKHSSEEWRKCYCSPIFERSSSRDIPNSNICLKRSACLNAGLYDTVNHISKTDFSGCPHRIHFSQDKIYDFHRLDPKNTGEIHANWI